jgi:hypothetical protein
MQVGNLRMMSHCRFFVVEQKREPILTGILAHDRSGDVQRLRPRRMRSNRYRRISGLTCRHPGGWGNRGYPRAARRRRRCAGRGIHSLHWISWYHWTLVLCLQAFIHQPYGCRTIITHMRINHLKDRLLTQPHECHQSSENKSTFGKNATPGKLFILTIMR